MWRKRAAPEPSIEDTVDRLRIAPSSVKCVSMTFSKLVMVGGDERPTHKPVPAAHAADGTKFEAVGSSVPPPRWPRVMGLFGRVRRRLWSRS